MSTITEVTDMKSHESFQVIPLLMTLAIFLAQPGVSSNLSDLWQAFASRGLYSIAELLVSV